MKRKLVLADRATAGRLLAQRIAELGLAAPVVLALPRGGVPVAAEISAALGAPLDLVLVRKIGAPDQPELAAAAVVDGGDAEIVANEEVAEALGLDAAALAARARPELAEIERRRRVYLGHRPRVPLSGRDLVVVDDGAATGTTMLAALKALARKKARRIVVALPVASRDAVALLRPYADEIVCLETPEPFQALSLHYRDFHQLEDEEVLEIMAAAPAAPTG
jgi:putative phosphoribosyl transferase